ncbi:MAG: hypothetical protein JO227_13390 [Acetobacteraceae bacterium]|nr:hypothetical protein [Acetobacteraceae bacterium]
MKKLIIAVLAAVTVGAGVASAATVHQDRNNGSPFPPAQGYAQGGEA